MTGIMTQSSAYTPIWHFEVASLPGIWKWQPPTTPAARKSKRQDLSVSGLFNGLISWLEKSDAGKPFIQPPDDFPMLQTASAEAIAWDVPTLNDIEPEIIRHSSIMPADLPEEISKLRTSINLLEDVNEDNLYQLFKACRRSLRRRIERGDLSIEGLVYALDPLDSAAKTRISDPKTTNRLSAMVRRTVLNAIDAAQKKNPNAHLDKLWVAFAVGLCESKAGNHDIQLFWRMMAVMPESLRTQIPAERIFNLTQSFVTAQAMRHNLFAHWSARAARFGDILSRLSEQQREDLEVRLQSFLLQDDPVLENSRRLRFSWLAIKAHDSSTTSDAFVACVCELINNQFVGLNSMQLWQLVVARLTSAGFVEPVAHKNLTETEYTSMTQRWTLIVTAVLASSNPDAGLRELCALLKGVGQMGALTRALTAWPLKYTRLDAVQAVAAACDDHAIALQLYDAVKSKPMAKQRLGEWDWRSWTPYVERMIMDPSLEPLRIWQVLRLTPKGTQKGGPLDNAAPDVQAKVELLDQMARLYIEAPHLKDRQILRQVQRCVTSQRSLTGELSSQMLASVMEIVTRDLEKGERGRTARLDWLVDLIDQTHGTERAANALSAIKGWRWVVDGVQGKASH